MNINNICYIIKSAIISVPSNTWQRSFRTTLHSRQSQFIRFNPGYGGVNTVSLSSTLNEHLCTQVLKHLNIHIYIVSMAYRYYRSCWPRADLLQTAALCWSKKREQQIKQTKTVKPYMHRVLFVWIIVAHFHLCSLLGTLSHYTVLEVSAVRRPMRVCCVSRWGLHAFHDILDSLTATCLVYNMVMYSVHGRCCQYGRCTVHTLAGLAGAWIILTPMGRTILGERYGSL